MLLRTILVFLPIAAGLTLLLGVTYINEQQILRLGANEPQEWLAQGAAGKIAAASSTDVAVEISTSASPYIDRYDASGKPISGNGYLHEKLPLIPVGVFSSAQTSGKNFVTWQPEPGIRQALVIDRATDSSGDYVVSGRSLSYVEWEESLLTERTFFGWLGIMLATFVISLFSAYYFFKVRS